MNTTDKRGHWTRGKHRNPPLSHWPETLDLLRSIAFPRRDLTAQLGVGESSVRRWLADRAVPPAETQDRLREILSAFSLRR